MQKVIPILDNGHGFGTPGKRSPKWADGLVFYEWEFNRDIVRRLQFMLAHAGIEWRLLVPETEDISLPERCRRANEIHNLTGKRSVLFSIHANAGGGTGWEAFTSVGQTEADKIATMLYEEAGREFPDMRMRKDMSDGDPDKESQFYILKHTVMPAVLSENFFYDNEKECRWLMQDEVRERIAKIHFNTIKRII